MEKFGIVNLMQYICHVFYDFEVRNHSPRLVASCANLFFVKGG